MANRRNMEAQERFLARRQREDDAPRLVAVVPHLQSLSLALDEVRGGEVLAGSAHKRPVPVQHAPALFVIPCGDRSCRDGGHDVTRTVMMALERGLTSFDGESRCPGTLMSSSCERTLRYRGTATYG